MTTRDSAAIDELYAISVAEKGVARAQYPEQLSNEMRRRTSRGYIAKRSRKCTVPLWAVAAADVAVASAKIYLWRTVAIALTNNHIAGTSFMFGYLSSNPRVILNTKYDNNIHGRWR